MTKKYVQVKTINDNRLMQVIAGPYNGNLERIEEGLKVTIRLKGNEITISGTDENVNHANTVIDKMAEKAVKTGNIDLNDVDALMRMKIKDMNDEKAVELHDKATKFSIKTKKKSITPRSNSQYLYVKSIQDHDLVFGLGPAGTGKTYLAVAMAVNLMIDGKIEKIILSRPAVEAGEHLGFLPGDLKEKIDPYLRPLYDALYDMMPNDIVDKKIEEGKIEIAPLAFMRGRTLNNAMVILDEAQNTTPQQMKMFLTRLGEGSKMVINGDMSQTDLPAGVKSGLADSMQILENIKEVGFVKFTDEDVVRHGLVSKIVRAYEQRNRQLRGY